MARRSVQINLDPAVEKLLYATLPGPLAANYVCTLRHWLEHKGPEWTAVRLKAVWNAALLLRSGSQAQIPQVCRDARIAVASSGLPKGLEGDMVRRWAHLSKPSKLRRMAVAFRSYTAIRLTNASPAQIAKAKKAITEPGTPCSCTPHTPVDFDRIRGGFHNRKNVLTLSPFGKRVNPQDMQRGIQFDHLGRLSGTSSYPHLLKIPSKDIQSNPFMSLCASMVTKGKVPTSLLEKLGDVSMRRSAEEYQKDWGDPTFGRITVIQEGGAKGRVVCSPNAWVQFYCHPYHRYLMTLVQALETKSPPTCPGLVYGRSCALDQVSGVDLALSRLNNGSFCQSVDLSSATDRFPLWLQQATCDELGIPEYASALEELKGPYWGPDGEMWSYGAGQPMGLYGSFPLFHLTHFMLLNGLSYKLGLRPDGENFCVLGDDVLIFDQDLLESYLWTLERLKVPISWHKSYGGNLVEFAGFLITKSSGTWTAFRPYKYGVHGEMSSVLNVLHSCGAAVREWSNYWTKAFEIYQRTQGLRFLDLSPLLPEEPDIRLDEGLPGLSYFGSVFSRLAYYDTQRGGPQPDLSGWVQDRYKLCQTEISEWDPYYFGEAQPEDIVFDNARFDPKLYTEQDMARKRSLYQMFWSDPVVKAYKQVVDV